MIPQILIIMTRNSRSAAAGSADFMRCSPTRNALKPLCNRFTSAEEWMPLSAHLDDSRGDFFAPAASDVSSVTSKRMQIPIIHADNLRAGRERAVQLRFVMHLDQRGHLVVRGHLAKPAQLGFIEQRGDQ